MFFGTPSRFVRPIVASLEASMRRVSVLFALIVASSLFGQTTATKPALERLAREVSVEESRAEIRRLLADKRGNTEFDASVASILAAFDAKYAEEKPAGDKMGPYKVGYYNLMMGLSGLRDRWKPDPNPDLQERYDSIMTIDMALRSIPVGQAAEDFYKKLAASEMFRKSPSRCCGDVVAIIQACEAQKKTPDYLYLILYNQPGLEKPQSEFADSRLYRNVGDRCFDLGLYDRALANFQKVGPENMGLLRVIDTYIAMKKWDAAATACDQLETDLPQWAAMAARFENLMIGAPPLIQGQNRESLQKTLADKRALIAANQTASKPLTTTPK
jgi:hypothetical protein